MRTTLDEMPGAYTRSKMQAEQLALAAAASGFPVVIANPTMPIGPHRNLTPPTAMLRYFLERRFQFYVDFVLNLVDVRDVAAGLLLVMERGQVGQRYILGGENVSLGKLLGMVSALSGRNAMRIPLPAGFARARRRGDGSDGRSRDTPGAVGDGRRRANRHALPAVIE